MKIIRNNILPPKPFAAINLLGVLFVRKEICVDPALINHERIHTAQMLELWVVPFYIMYVLEWVVRLPSNRFNPVKAYHELSFEREAYANMHDLTYFDRRKHFAMWRRRYS